MSPAPAGLFHVLSASQSIVDKTFTENYDCDHEDCDGKEHQVDKKALMPYRAFFGYRRGPGDH